MIIPTGYSEAEVIAIIQKISKRYRNYTYAYLTPEDVEQDCFILGMQSLEKYDGSSPLENFLSVCIRRKLLNEKRKQGQDYSGEKSEKYYVVNPISINIISNDESNIHLEDKLLNGLISQEIMDYIDTKLDISLRMDYLKFKDGLPMNKVRKENIKKELISILEQYHAR